MTRILIIDDQPLMRTLVRYVLEKWPGPLSIEEEANGIDAVVNLECRDYDLVICDVKMPDMDGFEVVRKIRHWNWSPNVPIIMLSASADEQSIAQGMAVGATCYVTKPFNEDQLISAVVECLGCGPEATEQPDFNTCTALDQDVLQSLLDLGDKEFIRELVDMALQDLPAQVARVELAFRSATTDHAIESAHQLRGTAFTLGGNKLAELAGILENLARQGDFEVSHHRPHLLAVRSNLSQVLVELQQLAA